MCGPAAPFVMAGIGVMSAIQSQQSAMAQAEATNDAFEANQKLQNEAYTKDMEAFWNEELAIQEQAYQNAEDAADTKIDILIERQQLESSLSQANAEGTGGQSSSRAFNILRRDMANRYFDVDEQFQRGVKALKGERKGLQMDKIQRRYSTMGAINSMQRDPGLSTTDRILGYVGAGVSGYAAGQDFAGPSGKPPTTGGTSGPKRSSLSGTSRATRTGRGQNKYLYQGRGGSASAYYDYRKGLK